MFRGSSHYQTGYDVHVPVPAEKVVARFVAAKLREAYRIKPVEASRAKEGEVTPRDIAKDLGISYPQVVEVLAEAKGVGQKFERAVADKFFDGSLDRLHAEAAKWAKTHVPDVSIVDGAKVITVEAKRAERYAALPAVRAMAHASGYDPEFVSKWEASLDYDGQPDPDVLWGLLKASYQDARLRRRASDAPLDELDTVRPPKAKLKPKSR